MAAPPGIDPTLWNLAQIVAAIQAGGPNPTPIQIAAIQAAIQAAGATAVSPVVQAIIPN